MFTHYATGDRAKRGAQDWANERPAMTRGDRIILITIILMTLAADAGGALAVWHFWR